MKKAMTIICGTLSAALFSGCAAIEPIAKIIAQKTAVYLCTKTFCKSDGNVTPAK
jgi:hypothetical protein